MDTTDSAAPEPERGATRLVRHALTDRLLHWATAASAIVLLATAFLPILGIDFAWVTIHWVTGIVLGLTVSIHVVRSLFWKELRTVWNLGEATGDLRAAIHHLFALVIITTLITGGLMLVKIDTPWWERNPYWLTEGTWGLIYILHDLAALLLVVMVMLHIYFALRPEKLFFARSMILGWVTREEHAEHHDPNRWQADPE